MRTFDHLHVNTVNRDTWRATVTGTSTNVLRGEAGACVLTGFDELQECNIKIVYPEYA